MIDAHNRQKNLSALRSRICWIQLSLADQELFSLASSPPHLDAMGAVHEPVEDTIGPCGVAYLFASHQGLILGPVPLLIH